MPLKAKYNKHTKQGLTSKVNILFMKIPKYIWKHFLKTFYLKGHWESSWNKHVFCLFACWKVKTSKMAQLKVIWTPHP